MSTNKENEILYNKSCPLCHSTQIKFFLSATDPDSENEKHYNLLKCYEGCGFVFLDYEKEDFNLHTPYKPDYFGRTKFSFFIYKTLFLKERKTIIEKLKHGGNLLDFGCGQGEFTRFMSTKKWIVSGVETPEYVNYKLKNKNEFTVYYNELEKIGFKDEHFDVVTMWHVLEHIDSPGKYLKEIYRILKRNGFLIISIPNINSLQARFFKGNWIYLDLPRHTNQFDPNTTTFLLESEKFRIKHIKHFSIEYNPFGWWQSFFNLIGCEKNFFYKYFKKGKISEKFSKPKRIYSIFSIIFLGIPFLFVAMAMSLIESAMKQGGSITVIAEKK